MDMKAVVLLIVIYDRPFLRVAQLDDLVDPILVDDATVDHEHLSIRGPGIDQRAPSGDWGGSDLVEPLIATQLLAENFVLELRARRPRSAGHDDG